MENVEKPDPIDEYEEAMTRSSANAGKKPVDYFYLLSSKKGRSAEERDQLLAEAKAHLDNNPVAHLPAQQFHETLRLVVSCAVHANNQTRTATGMTMANWLDVLDGKKTVQQFRERYSTWDWHGLASLNFHPFIAACYCRVLKDALAAFEQQDASS